MKEEYKKMAGLPWIWISMNISMKISMDMSMCGYQTSAILWIYP